MTVETVVFLVSAAIILAGAVGVIVAPNTVYAALSLIATLFGVAVLFIAQEAHFLAAVQVIVYAGAIVVLFLFVIMLLGVDQTEELRTEPLVAQRPVAFLAGAGVAGLVLVAVLGGSVAVTGRHTSTDPIIENSVNVNQVARTIFIDYVFALEITAALLTIAVVGAVVLTRRARPEGSDDGSGV